jgi:predicted RNA-binding protein Jag
MRKAVSLDALPELATAWCGKLGFKVSACFQPSGDEELFPNRLVLEGPDAHWLMANKGQALDALQFVLHEAQGEREEGRLAYLDVQGFRLFRMTEVKAMAAMAIERARQTGSHTFASLTPRERRWIHLTVARETGLMTESEGTGTIKALKVMRKA